MALTPNIWQNECYCRAVILIWWDFYTIYNNRVKRSTPNFAIWILRQALFRLCFRLLQPVHTLYVVNVAHINFCCCCFGKSLQQKIVCANIKFHVIQVKNLKQIHLEIRFLRNSVLSVCHIFFRRFNSFHNVVLCFFCGALDDLWHVSLFSNVIKSREYYFLAVKVRTVNLMVNKE